LIEKRKFADALLLLNRHLKAKPGDTWPLSNRGLVYYESGKPAEAVADWTLAAAAGDDFAQNRFGVLYMSGVPGRFSPDPEKGIEWLRKAAEQGNAEAQHNLPLALGQGAAQTIAVP